MLNETQNLSTQGLAQRTTKVLTRDENFQKTFNQIFNMDTGYGPIFDALLMSTIEVESWDTFSPEMVEVGDYDRPKGKGLFQYTGNTRDRFESYLADEGLQDDHYGNIIYIVDMLRKGSQPYKDNGGTHGDRMINLLNGIEQEGKHKYTGKKHTYKPTIEGINEYFLHHFMRPKDDKSLNRRIDATKKYMELFKQKTEEHNLNGLN
jgi:hypothetical protein